MTTNERKIIGSLAIDLGSTTTVVAFQAEDSPSAELLELPPISRNAGEIPSIIWQPKSDESSSLVGQAIINSPDINEDDVSITSDFKRWIGADKNLIPSRFRVLPEEAGELLIKEIWRRLPSNLKIKKLVLTAPIETYKEYRKWLTSLCSDLDVQEIALVDEPTAAAMGAGQEGGSKILVFDIGGSTIDMSMVLIEGGEGKPEPIAQLLRFNGEDLEGKSKQIFRGAKVLGKGGIRIGGRDFDRWILDHLYPGLKETNLLLNTVEKLKCRLSNTEISETKKLTENLLISEEGVKKEFSLSRIDLEELLQSKGLFKSLTKLLEQTLAQGRSKGCELADLTGIVIVGGGARMPAIKKWMINHVGAKKLLTPPPIEAVALGALKLTPGIMVKDVLNRGISLRFWNQRSKQHIWHSLFLPGQTWPTTKPLEIIISASTINQREIELKIADNEINEIQEVIYENGIPILKPSYENYLPKMIPWKIKPLRIKLDPPGEPGLDCLKLKFSIDSSCQLHVSGIDIRNGLNVIEQSIGSIR